MKEIDYSVGNVDVLLRKYSPLINKLSYILYNQYHVIMDYSDAQQEVRLCMWRCLSTYKPDRCRFMTYFYNAFRRMQKRLYHTYKGQIVVSQSSESMYMNDDGDYTSPDGRTCDERFVAKPTNDLDIRLKLSKESVEIYDLFMAKYVLAPWNISRELSISRYHAQLRYNKFRDEVANLCTAGI